MTKRFFFAFVALWVVVFGVAGQQQPAAQGRGNTPVTLPDGPGNDVLQATCSKCHSLGFITNGFGYTRADWDKAIGTMVAHAEGRSRHRAVVSRDELSRKEPAQVRDRARQGVGVVQGMGRALARLAAARSARDAGRRDLVDRPVGQRARAGSIRRPAR